MSERYTSHEVDYKSATMGAKVIHVDFGSGAEAERPGARLDAVVGKLVEAAPEGWRRCCFISCEELFTRVEGTGKTMAEIFDQQYGEKHWVAVAYENGNADIYTDRSPDEAERNYEPLPALQHLEVADADSEPSESPRDTPKLKNQRATRTGQILHRIK